MAYTFPLDSNLPLTPHSHSIHLSEHHVLSRHRHNRCPKDELLEQFHRSNILNVRSSDDAIRTAKRFDTEKTNSTIVATVVTVEIVATVVHVAVVINVAEPYAIGDLTICT